MPMPSNNGMEMIIMKKMNWYFYWYFTIYALYKRFSNDSGFDIFATSMFSFFVANLLFSLIICLTILLGLDEFAKRSHLIITLPVLSVFIVNYFIFLPKRKQLENYCQYRKIQTYAKNFIAILFSILSIVLFLLTIILGRKYLTN